MAQYRKKPVFSESGASFFPAHGGIPRVSTSQDYNCGKELGSLRGIVGGVASGTFECYSHRQFRDGVLLRHYLCGQFQEILHAFRCSKRSLAYVHHKPVAPPPSIRSDIVLLDLSSMSDCADTVLPAVRVGELCVLDRYSAVYQSIYRNHDSRQIDHHSVFGIYESPITLAASYTGGNALSQPSYYPCPHDVL